ncbi:MAG: hypothetical protein JRG94_14915, partial [Deltaproteobacteria bacterium]|nr:hypothetical protein [Deltaproteobacteria bacterium]
MAKEISSAKVSAPLDWRSPDAPPPADESGGEAVVALTPAAEVEVRRLLLEEGKPGLRLGIKGGGCS